MNIIPNRIKYGPFVRPQSRLWKLIFRTRNSNRGNVSSRMKRYRPFESSHSRIKVYGYIYRLSLFPPIVHHKVIKGHFLFSTISLVNLPMPLTHQVEQHLTGEFSNDPCGSICANPGECCFFYFCAPCAIHAQRKEILKITGEPYVPCGGVCQCFGFEEPCGSSIWLVAEALCCMHWAMGANHFLVQTRLNKRNSWCDNLCKIANCEVTCAFAVARSCFDCSDEAENLLKGAHCICPCAHCQNAIELAEFKSGKSAYAGPPQGVVYELPNHFTHVGRGPASAPAQMQIPLE
jgi:hypothetical protein